MRLCLPWRVRLLLLTVVAGLAAVFTSGCNGTGPAPAPEAPPNILWVVWDTVRADRMSVYGHSVPTTPFVEEWSKGARVYEDCVSTASHTVPSHASMFTGLLAAQHGASNAHMYLDDRFTTIAELLHRRGYASYLFSANPHIAKSENVHRGFEVEEHPWDEKYRADAIRIVRNKVPDYDHSSELATRFREGKGLIGWNIKACGELTQRGVEAWLGGLDGSRPFFIFLNYMEAHRPYIPALLYRERVMSPEWVDRSYQVDRSWTTMWSYSFGLHEYTQEELDIMAATYDATVAELDDLFRNLIEMLQAKGQLDNTIVILTSDHGELLGEHHMLGHQFSVHEPLIRVPLIVHYPRRFTPGRDRKPVVTFDIFPTLIELTGAETPGGLRSEAVSLLATRDRRSRMAEYPAAFEVAFKKVATAHPGFDPTAWRRSLQALIRGDLKYIRSSDGRGELYDLSRDPGELQNLRATRADESGRMELAMDRYLSALTRPRGEAQVVPEVSPEQIDRLRALGYAEDGDENQESDNQNGSPDAAADPNEQTAP